MYIMELHFLKNVILVMFYSSYSLVQLRKDIINVFLQIIYSQKIFYVHYMEHFMYAMQNNT